MKYTVAIPAYKAKFLKECIESVLNQSYSDFELIIVNDASPENLDDIVYLFNDERIRYFKNQINFGAENVVDNWNICLSFAKGEYILLLGDDDKLCGNCIEEYENLIRKYPELDIYHSRSYIINENSEITAITQSWPEYETVYENIFHRIKGYRTQFISDFLYKTETLKMNGGYFKLPLAWASDDLSSYIAMKNKGIAHTQKPLLEYRSSSYTLSNSGSSFLKLKAINLEYMWLNDFVLNDKRNDLLTDLFKQNVKAYLPYYTNNKIVYTISQELRNGFYYNLYKFTCNRKQLGVKFAHLLKATIKFLNNRFR